MLQDASNKRPPFKAPFTPMVPRLVRAIRGHIVDTGVPSLELSVRRQPISLVVLHLAFADKTGEQAGAAGALCLAVDWAFTQNFLALCES